MKWAILVFILYRLNPSLVITENKSGIICFKVSTPSPLLEDEKTSISEGHFTSPFHTCFASRYLSFSFHGSSVFI